MVAAQCDARCKLTRGGSSTSSFFSNVHLHSDWQPGVRLAYLEERERRKHVSVGSLMSGMPMES